MEKLNSKQIIEKILNDEDLSPCECKVCECGEIIAMNSDSFKGVQSSEGLRDYNLSLHNCQSCGTTKAKKIKKES